MFTIKTARTHELDDSRRAAICALCTAAHEEDFGTLFTFLPPDGLHFLGYLDDQLIGHAVVTTRWLQHNDQPLMRTAYIDAVSTLPAVQHRGYGSALMREVARVIADDFEIACLETGKEGFYHQVGWQTWRGALGGRSPDGLIPTPDQKGIMILRLPRTPDLDLDGRLTIEQSPARIW